MCNITFYITSRMYEQIDTLLGFIYSHLKLKNAYSYCFQCKTRNQLKMDIWIFQNFKHAYFGVRIHNLQEKSWFNHSVPISGRFCASCKWGHQSLLDKQFEQKVYSNKVRHSPQGKAWLFWKVKTYRKTSTNRGPSEESCLFQREGKTVVFLVCRAGQHVRLSDTSI